MIIGEVIKKYRLKAQLTQQELADKTGLSKSFISHIEREDKIPHLDKLKKLSKALDVPMSIIMLEAADIPEIDKQLKPNDYINNVVSHLAKIIYDLQQNYELRYSAKARARAKAREKHLSDVFNMKYHIKDAKNLNSKPKYFNKTMIDKLKESNHSDTKN